MPVRDILTIASSGLLVGTEFAVSAFVNPVVWKLEDRAGRSDCFTCSETRHRYAFLVRA
jgi:hypothetical protein